MFVIARNTMPSTHMNCPTCKSTQLVMSERQGIEIDYCPSCRGVWLDRGELDKIIERSTQGQVVSNQSPQPPQQQQQQYQQPMRQQRMDDSDYGNYRYKRRKSWLAELFD